MTTLRKILIAATAALAITAASAAPFNLLLCAYDGCHTQDTYTNVRACVYWQERYNKADTGGRVKYQCVNERGETVTANVIGCTFARSSILGNDGTGDGKAAGVICPKTPIDPALSKEDQLRAILQVIEWEPASELHAVAQPNPPPAQQELCYDSGSFSHGYPCGVQHLQ